MNLGLIVICLYAIFRRTNTPWLVAGRMLMVLFVLAIVLQIVEMLHVANIEQIKLIEAISLMTATIYTGFHQSKTFSSLGTKTPIEKPAKSTPVSP